MILALWLGSLALAGDVEKAQQVLRKDGPDAAIAFVQAAMAKKQSFTELQALKGVLDGASFARAEAAGTFEAYNTYVREFPDGPNAPLARVRLCGLDPACSGAPAAPNAAPASTPTAAALPSIDAPLRTGKKRPLDAAVIVGIEDYAFLPDVPYAARDADAFQDVLAYSRGVAPERIHRVNAGSLEAIKAAVTEAGRETRSGGYVWVFFAGHGAADPTDGRRLLLGDDVRADPVSFSARGLAIDDLERLAGAGGGKAVVVLDACFTGTGRGGTELAPGLRFAVPASVLAAPEQGARWTATGPAEVSGPLPEVRHGAFTYFAIGALRGWADGELDGARDGSVTGAEANAFVQRALRSSGVRNQQPVWVGADDLVLIEGVDEVAPNLLP